MSNGRQKWLNGRQTPTKLKWPAWDHQKESEISMRRKKAASRHKKWTPHFDETTPGRIPLSQLPFDLQSKTRHQTFPTIRACRLANWLANEIKQDRHKRNQTRATQTKRNKIDAKPHPFLTTLRRGGLPCPNFPSNFNQNEGHKLFRPWKFPERQIYLSMKSNQTYKFHPFLTKLRRGGLPCPDFPLNFKKRVTTQ